MDRRKLISKIYESVGDPDATADMVRGLASLGGGTSAQYGVIDLNGNWLGASVVGVDPAALSPYVRYHAATDPRMAFALRHPGRLFTCSQATKGNAAFERSALVDFLNRYEARYCMLAVLKIGPAHLAGLGLMRHRRAGPFEPDEAHRIARLLPHFQKAMSLHLRLGLLESRLFSLHSLVDRISTPALCVDSVGTLIHANAAGLDALHEETWLKLRARRVVPRLLRQESQLIDLIAGVAGPGNEFSERFNVMRVCAADERLATLLAYNVGQMPQATGSARIEVLLFLTGSAPVSTSHIQALFDLTAAESMLAECLVHGEAPADVAERLELSRETVKTQLSALFRKTDTRRQAELVAKLLAMRSVALRPPNG